MFAQIGSICAVFRHRIFDFGPAVNRALIFAIVGAILFGEPPSAILEPAVYLWFNQMKRGV